MARIRRPKGVRGHVKAEPLTHDPERFDHLGAAVVQHEGRDDLPVELVEWRAEPPGLLLKFAGIDTPERASELLAGGYVTVSRDEVASLPEDTFYVFDLVGCQVVDEHGHRVGELSDVLPMPSTDVYRVQTGAGEVLIPAVADYIVAVAVAERRVVVRGIEELLEER